MPLLITVCITCYLHVVLVTDTLASNKTKNMQNMIINLSQANEVPFEVDGTQGSRKLMIQPVQVGEKLGIRLYVPDRGAVYESMADQVTVVACVVTSGSSAA